MQNRRGYTCSPSPRCPVGKEGRVELSLPLRRSQANVEAEPQAAATHMTQEKAEDTLHWASSEKGGTAFSGGTVRRAAWRRVPGSWPSGFCRS